MTETKLCVDCKFCLYTESSRDGKKEYYCHHPNNVCIVSGEIIPIDCYTMRKDYLAISCRSAGNWFVHKDDEMY